MELQIIPYESSMEPIWDRFVMNESANGTFLQTRRFLNYHPKGRFQDASFLVENEKGAVVAAVPAAVQQRDGKKVLVSHPGSTYGGPVIRETCTSAERCLDIVQAIDRYVADSYDRSEFKLTPDLLSKRESKALGYALYHEGFSNYEELSVIVDLEGKSEENLLSSFDENKKRNTKKAMKHGLKFVRLMSRGEIEAFYELLKSNLAKYSAVPVHTVDELEDFIARRLKGEVELWGVWDEDRLVAGTMTFYFEQTNLLHTQYLASDLQITDYSPSTFLYYSILHNAIQGGYQTVSFGITTEDHGRYLNQGLVSNKESFDGKHSINWTYYKNYGRE